MRGGRFYSIPWDAYNDFGMRRLRMLHGDGPAAFGRWHILLGMLYDADGCILADDASTRIVLMSELELDEDGLDGFMHALATVGFIDGAAYENRGSIVSPGVVEQIEYLDKKRRAASVGGRAKAAAAKAKKDAEGHRKDIASPEEKC